MIVSQHVQDVVYEALSEAMRQLRQVPSSPLGHATPLSALGIGSVALLELATQIEERLSLELPIDRVARARSVGELLSIVEEIRGARGAEA